MNIISLLASDNYIVVNRDMLKEYGINVTLMLGELASEYNYWKKENKLEDGMFYSTIENIEENTGLSKYRQSEALKTLSEMGVVKTVVKGLPAKRFFKLDVEKLEKLFSNSLKYSCQKTGKLEVKKLDTNNNNKKIINNNNKKDNRVACAHRTQKGSDKPKRKRFAPPTVEDVEKYCTERKNGIDAQHFIDYYEARGWELSKGRKVKDWKACVRTWERNSYSSDSSRKQTEPKPKEEQMLPPLGQDYYKNGKFDLEGYNAACKKYNEWLNSRS